MSLSTVLVAINSQTLRKYEPKTAEIRGEKTAAEAKKASLHEHAERM
jgi:hypothetical protein